MLAQPRRQWPSNTSILGQCIVLSGVSGAGLLKRHQHNAAVRKHGTITQCCFNDGQAPKTLKQHWLNTTCLRKVYNRTGDRLVLGQHRRRLTGIKLAMVCDARPTLNQNLAGRPTSSAGQHRRWWWKEYTSKVYFILSPWFFSNYILDI